MKEASTISVYSFSILSISLDSVNFTYLLYIYISINIWPFGSTLFLSVTSLYYYTEFLLDVYTLVKWTITRADARLTWWAGFSRTSWKRRGYQAHMFASDKLIFAPLTDRYVLDRPQWRIWYNTPSLDSCHVGNKKIFRPVYTPIRFPHSVTIFLHQVRRNHPRKYGLVSVEQDIVIHSDPTFLIHAGSRSTRSLWG